MNNKTMSFLAVITTLAAAPMASAVLPQDSSPGQIPFDSAQRLGPHPDSYGHSHAAVQNLPLPNFDHELDVVARADRFAGAPVTTAAKIPVVDYNRVRAHMEKFQEIADRHGNNRAHGLAGHRETVDYIAEQLRAVGFSATIQEFTFKGKKGFNVIAELPGGDPNDVLMIGAHNDSVTRGPGINDNGSGSAGILALAQQFAEENVTFTKQVRFAWWGAEEIGLVGSDEYVAGLSAEQRRAISGYYNFDMIASPNGGFFVYDADDSDGVGGGPFPEGSAYLEKVLEAGFQRIGVPTLGTDPGGRSDHGPFIRAGIAAGGIFTGAEGRKSAKEAKMWGGQSGTAYDACYHARCDTINNLDEAILRKNLEVIAYSVVTVAGAAAKPSPTVTATSSPTVTVTASPTVTVSPTVTTTPTVTSSPTGTPQSTFYNTTKKVIEDYQAVSSSVTSTFAGAKKVALVIDVQHACAQNLEYAVVTPDGRRHVVKRSRFTRQCTSLVEPSNNTYSMRTKSAGQWTFEVNDKFNGHTGVLNGWGVEFSR